MASRFTANLLLVWGTLEVLATIFTVWGWMRSRRDGRISSKRGCDKLKGQELQYNRWRNTIAWWTSLIISRMSSNNENYNIRDEYRNGPGLTRWITERRWWKQGQRAGLGSSPPWRGCLNLFTPQAGKGLRPVWMGWQYIASSRKHQWLMGDCSAVDHPDKMEHQLELKNHLYGM